MRDNDMRRTPPYNVEAERSVIGSILMDNQTIEMIDIITADDFYLDAHKKIYKAIIKNYKTTAIDIVTIGALLGEELTMIGGVTFIAALVDDIPSAANIVHYAKIVKEMSIRRRLLDSAYQITELAYGSDDLKEVIEKSQKSVMAINPLNQGDTIKSAKEVAKTTFEQIETRNKKGGLVGLSTGLVDLDEVTGGLHEGDLTIIAARPGMGKTCLADNIAHYAGMKGNASLIFSIEMPNEALMVRMLSSMTKIENRQLRKGYVHNADWPKLVDASSRIASSLIYFDDSPMITPQELRIRARKAKADYDIKLLVLDYIQLMQPSQRGRSREQEVSEISSTLKSIARELSIAVIGVSQLNRELEKRPDKRPQISDLRESGCLHGDTLVFNQNIEALQAIKILNGESNIPIMSMDRNKADVVVMKKGFHTGRKQLYELELMTGHKILATANHKFLERENTWTRLDELNDESLVAIPLTFDLDQKETHRELHEARFIAMMLGNGCSGARRGTQYTSNSQDGDLCDEVIDCANKISNNTLRAFKKETICKSRNSKWINAYFPAKRTPSRNYHNPIVEYLKNIGLFGKRSKEKEIPQFVFFESKEFRTEFIKYLFATDGTISIQKEPKQRISISYSSASYRLITGLQLLLQSVGILSTVQNIKQRQFSWYTLSIYSVYFQKKYMEEIGFAGERKSKINKDAIELINQTTAGWTKYILNEEKTMAYVKVKSVTQKYVDDVYDIEVPQTHNFIANGIVVHNSIEQDADTILLIYRDEIYNKDEENPEKGIAEIGIGKNRNGQITTIKCVFSDKYQKFSDMAPQYQMKRINYGDGNE